MRSTSYPDPYDRIGRSYEVLRHGGASPGRAEAELGLPRLEAWALEARFRKAPGRQMRPRFARCAAHVAAVTKAGGYPVLR